MPERDYGQQFWEQLWSKTLRDHARKATGRPPNAHLIEAVQRLSHGRALDAGCGHGSDTLWLAAHGWQVTAVDFSPSALAHGEAVAQEIGTSIASRIVWEEGDLTTWIAPAGQFELVVCLYVHVAGPMQAFVRRMAGAVSIGGRLLMVGHRPIDPKTGAKTSAAGQEQVSVQSVVSALDPQHWEVVLGEERTRSIVGSGVDAVILARRLA